MTPPTQTPRAPRQLWVDRLAEDRPDLVYMAPFLAYLLLLGLRDVWGPEWVWLFTIIRGVGALLVLWMLRKHLPPLGKPHFFLAIGLAAVSTVIWVGGQHLLDGLGLPRRLPLWPIFSGVPDPPEKINPFNVLGGLTLAPPLSWFTDWFGPHGLVWVTIVTRIAVAATTVALVEEIFWRGFLLRAMIDWGRFEKIPLGTFHLRAFVLTAVVSVMEHPDNWGVSIALWLVWNALMIWKKSLLFLILIHGLTNLFLYVYVVRTNDWIFW